MGAGDTPASSQLTKMLTARVPAGLGDQIREAARAEGVRPGALIRDAIAQRIERVGGASSMTDDQRAAISFFAGEHADSLVQRLERAETDAGFRADLERRVEAYRFSFIDKIVSAHGLLGEYLERQGRMKAGEPVSPDDAAAAIRTLEAAYGEIQAARGIEVDLSRLVCRGMES